MHLQLVLLRYMQGTITIAFWSVQNILHTYICPDFHATLQVISLVSCSALSTFVSATDKQVEQRLQWYVHSKCTIQGWQLLPDGPIPST